MTGQIRCGDTLWDNVRFDAKAGDAACASLVHELSHAPPMRLRSRDPIGCSCAVVSAMGTSRFDAHARPRSARVESRLFPARAFNQFGQAGDRGRVEAYNFPGMLIKDQAE